MHEAGGLNKKILEHSSTAELVFVTMPPIPAEHNTGKTSRDHTKMTANRK